MLTLDYGTGDWFDGYIRLNRYGSWKSTGGLFSPGDASDISSYSSEIIVDVEATTGEGNPDAPVMFDEAMPGCSVQHPFSFDPIDRLRGLP
jgi:hypothetical protein